MFPISWHLSRDLKAVKAQALWMHFLNTSERENSIYKGPEAKGCLAYSRNSKEISMPPRLNLQGRAAKDQTMKGFIGCWGTQAFTLWDRTPLEDYFKIREQQRFMILVFKWITLTTTWRTDLHTYISGMSFSARQIGIKFFCPFKS